MPTLGDLKPRYEDYLTNERSLAKQTVTAYMGDLDRMIAIIGDADVKNITLDDLRMYIRTMRKAGAAVATIARRIHSLNTFYKWLVLERLADEVISARLQIPRRETKQPVWLSPDELKRFVNTPSRLRVAWMLLAWFGLRRSELLALTWGDIKLDEQVIVIRGTKSKKDRVLPIPAACVDKLRPASVTIDSSHRLIPRPAEHRVVALSVTPFARAFKRHVAACGLSPLVTPHTIRHSFATSLIQRGVPLTTVKTLLGHVDVKTTMLYVHHNDEMLKSAMERHVLQD